MSLFDLFRKPKPQPPVIETIYPAEFMRFFITASGNPVVVVKDSLGREGFMNINSNKGILRRLSEFKRQYKIQGEVDPVLTAEMLKEMGNTSEAKASVGKI